MNGEAIVWSAAALGGAVAGLVVYEVLVRLFAGEPHGSEATATFGRADVPPAVARTGARSTSGTGRLARVQDAFEALAHLLERFAPLARADADALKERLRRAGVAVAPETWRCVRVVAAAGCSLVVGVPLVSATPLPLYLSLVLAAGAGALGWALPAADLARRRRLRREAIEARLPDAMELLGIAIAAGSPTEQCFREVAASMDGPLADEFALVDQEVNLLGRTREQALESMARRCGSSDVTAFVAQLTQAISQGSSVASGLASQAALAREMAQADVLERIRAMPTKLDIVLSLCFLPPTVVLVVVPTVVNLLAFLNDSMT